MNRLSDHDTGPAVAPQDYLAADDEVDISELFAIVSGGRLWIALFTAAALFLGAFYAWVTPRQYLADALVQVEKAQGGMSAMFGELGTMFGEETPVAAEVELIRSRMVVSRVVDALNLEISAEPQYFPVIGRALARGWSASGEGDFRTPLFGLSHFAWGGERIDVTTLDVPPRLVGAPIRLITRADDTYDLVGPDGEGLARGGAVGEPFEIETPLGPLRVFVRNLEARPGTQFELVRRNRDRVIGQLSREVQVSERGRQSGILSISLEAESPEAAMMRVNRLVQAYQRQNVERRSEEAEQTLEFLQGQLPQLREQLDLAEGRLNAYRLERGSADLTKETEIVLQQSVALEQRRLELEQKRQEATRRYTADHPVIQTIDSQLGNLSGEMTTVTGRVRDLPETQQELLRLTRDVQVNTELYTSLLNSAQELQVARAGTVGNVRIVDLAVRPQGPSKPRTSLIVALSLVLGGMLGVMFVFLRRALQRGIIEPGQVERELGMSTYASIPFSQVERKYDRARKRGKRIEGSGLLAVDQPQDVCTEALRSLRTALHFALMDAPNRIVMLTGPSPGLGKSFVSLNFAAVLAEVNTRVLVIDCDLRRGHMHSVLRQNREPGLTDCLAGNADLSDVLRAVPGREGLFLLSTGTIAPNPTELLLSDSFRHLLDSVAQRFDYVIIDTPPVLAVTDAAIVGRMAGTTLMLLKEGEHPVPVLRDALSRLRQAGVSVRGVVFNMVGRTGAGRYGSKYSYRYGYTYAYKSAKS